MNLSASDLPNYVRPEAVKVRPDLDMIADILGGTRAVQDNAQSRKYLRKWKDEAPEVYDIRRTCETVFEGLGRTLSACVGMLFAKPPAVVWNASEAAFEQQWQNLDGQGTSGPVLAKRFSEQSLRDGIGVILVDHPTVPEGVTVTAENEARLGLRPTWAIYQRSQVFNWRVELVNNAQTVTQITFEECALVPSGAYGVAEVKRYRTLRLVPTGDGSRVATWELKQETKEAGMQGFVLVGAGVFQNRTGETRDTLPIGIAYTGRTDAPCCATIPLLGVAWANLSHWRLSTALTFAREVASYAQGVLIGALASAPGPNGTTIPGRVKLGPLALIHLQGDGASFEWKAPPVEAFAALERGIEEKLKQMGQMGMSFMVTDTRAAETEAAKKLDATAENSTLATAGQGIEDAWNTGLEIHAWYLGIEKAGAPVMTINKDFDAIALDPQTMAVYVQAVRDAGLPVEYLVRAWITGGRLPQMDENEITLLVARLEANAQAAADKAEEDKADALAMANGDGGKGMPGGKQKMPREGME